MSKRFIPCLYAHDETEFTTEGIGRLPDIVKGSTHVREGRNGIYEMEFKYPIMGVHYSELEPRKIVLTTHDASLDLQPFEIYSISKPKDGIVTVKAQHVSYRLSGIILEPFTASSLGGVFSAIPQHTIGPCPFTFTNTKAVASSYTLKNPASIRSILAGQQGSLLDIYGKGEYTFDKFNVKLDVNRGSDIGKVVRYGVDLTELTEEIDASSLVFGVVGFWTGSATAAGANSTATNEPTTIMGTLQTCQFYDASDPVKSQTIAVDFSSEWQDGENLPTQAWLNDQAAAYLTDNEPWAPKVSLKISFIDTDNLATGYDLLPMQKAKLCDYITVVFKDLGVNAKAEIIEVDWDPLEGRYWSMTVGEAASSLATTLSAEFATKKGMNTRVNVSMSMMQTAVKLATDLITGNLGGYVIMHDSNGDGEPDELLIMDTANIQTATKVWRWNVSGLGYSGTGYAGPYTTAITMDGGIVADFIKTGILNAIRIESADGTSYWDLPGSELVIGSSDGNTKSSIQDGIVRSYNPTTNRSADMKDGYVRTYYNNVKGTQIYTNSDQSNLTAYHADGTTPGAYAVVNYSTGAASFYIRTASGHTVARIANDAAEGGYFEARKTYTDANNETVTRAVAGMGASTAGGYLSMYSINSNTRTETFRVTTNADGAGVVVRRALNGAYKKAVEIVTGNLGGGIAVNNSSEHQVVWISSDSDTNGEGTIGVNNYNGYQKVNISVDRNQDCGIVFTRNNGQTVVNMLSCSNNGGQFIQYNSSAKTISALFANSNNNGSFQLMDATGAVGFQIGFNDYGDCIMGIRKGTGSSATWSWY